jgi:hypothetical protein
LREQIAVEIEDWKRVYCCGNWRLGEQILWRWRFGEQIAVVTEYWERTVCCKT